MKNIYMMCPVCDRLSRMEALTCNECRYPFSTAESKEWWISVPVKGKRKRELVKIGQHPNHQRAMVVLGVKSLKVKEEAASMVSVDREELLRLRAKEHRLQFLETANVTLVRVAEKYEDLKNWTPYWRSVVDDPPTWHRNGMMHILIVKSNKFTALTWGEIHKSWRAHGKSYKKLSEVADKWCRIILPDA